MLLAGGLIINASSLNLLPESQQSCFDRKPRSRNKTGSWLQWVTNGGVSCARRSEVSGALLTDEFVMRAAGSWQESVTRRKRRFSVCCVEATHLLCWSEAERRAAVRCWPAASEVGAAAVKRFGCELWKQSPLKGDVCTNRSDKRIARLFDCDVWP